MGAALSAGKSKGASPDINITPLVDVVLVLLIIFMVVAPALNEGAQIELPKVLSPDLKPKDMNPIEVTIANDGTTVVDKEKIDPRQLNAKLTSLHEAKPDRALIIKLDENTRYAKVRSTMRDLQHIGFKGVLLKVVEKKPAKNAGGA